MPTFRVFTGAGDTLIFQMEIIKIKGDKVHILLCIQHRDCSAPPIGIVMNAGSGAHVRAQR